MSNKVMICFDYERDLWRASRVLNTWDTNGFWEVTGFADLEAWKNVKLRGTYGVNRWLTDEMVGTTVTLVLVGALTSKQPHVLHVLQQSIKQGNRIVLVDLHNIRDPEQRLGTRGPNPVAELTTGAPPSGTVSQYDWVNSDGAKNLDAWLDRAAKGS